MLIPDNVTEFSSKGEQILFLRFKNDNSTNEMYILHSLFTNHHCKNISGELDFLVISPNEGIFAIEVKHGGVSRKNGDWQYTNRDGKTTSTPKSPFSQVDASMNSIRSYILKKIEHNKMLHSRLSKILWGTGVAFTSMNEFVDFGTEGHQWQVLTKQGLMLPIGNHISTLSKGWHNENKNKRWYDVDKSRPTKKDCELVLEILRGDFDIDYSELNKLNDNEIIIEEYTKEQFKLLDFVNYNDRCLIEGTAGTGKTLMAIEIAHRKIKDDLKIGFFCFNTKLGKKLSDAFEEALKNQGHFVGTLHSFLSRHTSSVPPEKEMGKQSYYLETLPFEFLANNDELDESEKYDILIIDEAQDLLSPYFIEVFDLILKGGVKNGNWIMFGDFSNQAIFLNNPEDCIKILSTQTNFTRFPPLRINCRNSKKIASLNTLLTGVDFPDFRYKILDGNNVTKKFPNISKQTDTIEQILIDVLAKGIPPEKITMLSPKKTDKSILASSEVVKDFIKKGGIVTTIQSYKGLENTIVILFDFDEIVSEITQKLLYVGISRPRQELFIVLNKTLENSFNSLIQNNSLKIS